MKEPLVCIAPDGSLEVWTKQQWLLAQPFRVDLYQEDLHPYGDNSLILYTSPEFWGREVLSEL